MFDNAIELESTPEYEAFVDKFKPKKTTDECYTPEPIYEAVLGWACERYGFDPACVVRLFYPGGDYENYEYPDGCVVLDNPPFSILTKICQFYLDRGIRFFLFAPSLTAFSGKSVVMRMNHIICDANIVYENVPQLKRPQLKRPQLKRPQLKRPVRTFGRFLSARKLSSLPWRSPNNGKVPVSA